LDPCLLTVPRPAQGGGACVIQRSHRRRCVWLRLDSTKTPSAQSAKWCGDPRHPGDHSPSTEYDGRVKRFGWPTGIAGPSALATSAVQRAVDAAIHALFHALRSCGQIPVSVLAHHQAPPSALDSPWRPDAGHGDRGDSRYLEGFQLSPWGESAPALFKAPAAPVAVCNPTNPTGHSPGSASLILSWLLPTATLVVVHELLRPSRRQRAAQRRLQPTPNLLVCCAPAAVRLAGLRIGFAISERGGGGSPSAGSPPLRHQQLCGHVLPGGFGGFQAFTMLRGPRCCASR